MRERAIVVPTKFFVIAFGRKTSAICEKWKFSFNGICILKVVYEHVK